MESDAWEGLTSTFSIVDAEVIKQSKLKISKWGAKQRSSLSLQLTCVFLLEVGVSAGSLCGLKARLEEHVEEKSIESYKKAQPHLAYKVL